MYIISSKYACKNQKKKSKYARKKCKTWIAVFKFLSNVIFNFNFAMIGT